MAISLQRLYHCLHGIHVSSLFSNNKLADWPAAITINCLVSLTARLASLFMAGCGESWKIHLKHGSVEVHSAPIGH